MKPYSIHWFRRDLRIAGNPALEKSFTKSKGRVVGFFSFDSSFLAREDFSHTRFQFFLNTLKALKEELKSVGSDLLVLDKMPDEAFLLLLKNLSHPPEQVSWNRDYEPFARKRDAKIETLLKENKVDVVTESDHLLIEPVEFLSFSEKKTPYQIYTPFSKIWLRFLKEKQIKNRVARQASGLKYLEKKASGKSEKIFSLSWSDLIVKKSGMDDALDSFIQKNAKHVSIPIPKAGSLEAFQKMEEFKEKLKNYSTARDIPSIAGTSQFSIFFKNGSLTTTQVIQHLKLDSSQSEGAKKFLNELIWREFYYHILYHFPHVEKKCFKQAYDALKWENNPKYFEAWKEGKTGYHIVDAGMRQLNATGWMHNRVRMIVASFLTKDLLVDWRWGEQYFMEKLIDGDLAPNNGGWQWSASTGCDAQPYFRIFNPSSQSEKFDPQGLYIKKWVPETKDFDYKQIHSPKNPIVDHSIQREKALTMYKTARA